MLHCIALSTKQAVLFFEHLINCLFHSPSAALWFPQLFVETYKLNSNQEKPILAWTVKHFWARRFCLLLTSACKRFGSVINFHLWKAFWSARRILWLPQLPLPLLGMVLIHCNSAFYKASVDGIVCKMLDVVYGRGDVFCEPGENEQRSRKWWETNRQCRHVLRRNRLASNKKRHDSLHPPPPPPTPPPPTLISTPPHKHLP